MLGGTRGSTLFYRSPGISRKFGSRSLLHVRTLVESFIEVVDLKLARLSHFFCCRSSKKGGMHWESLLAHEGGALGDLCAFFFPS